MSIILYALQTFYHSCIDMIKASILFTYLRIFHLPNEKIRIALWVIMAINILSGLAFIFVSLFRCQPISLAWKFWTGKATGKSTQIWGMNLARRKKIAVMSMFSLGLFITIVSAIRIPALLDFRKDPLNPTVAMMPIVIWSGVELNVGIFIACIPSIRQFFVRFILGHSEKKKCLAPITSG
ncbi:cfem domain-containing protein [Colletotrichum tabaci]|uniref:Cfem domain-containing protein n=1 Tax=Colletotrichum tabaci TaxID=1209068 RepID=A0AAV9SSH2_9PEZI